MKRILENLPETNNIRLDEVDYLDKIICGKAEQDGSISILSYVSDGNGWAFRDYKTNKIGTGVFKDPKCITSILVKSCLHSVYQFESLEEFVQWVINQ